MNLAEPRRPSDDRVIISAEPPRVADGQRLLSVVEEQLSLRRQQIRRHPFSSGGGGLRTIPAEPRFCEGTSISDLRRSRACLARIPGRSANRLRRARGRPTKGALSAQGRALAGGEEILVAIRMQDRGALRLSG